MLYWYSVAVHGFHSHLLYHGSVDRPQPVAVVFILMAKFVIQMLTKMTDAVVKTSELNISVISIKSSQCWARVAKLSSLILALSVVEGKQFYQNKQ